MDLTHPEADKWTQNEKMLEYISMFIKSEKRDIQMNYKMCIRYNWGPRDKSIFYQISDPFSEDLF